ncbi:MAG TPA: phage major capsid protein [Allosphingosinicella sp.]|nr:phage major capsid protein [Allosphingosinicella sp.]
MQHIHTRPAGAGIIRPGAATFPAALRRASALSGVPLSVHANADNPRALFDQLTNELKTFCSQQDNRVQNLADAMQAIQEQVNGNIVPSHGGVTGPVNAIPGYDPDYSRTFASHFRRGDGEDYLRTANGTGDRATVHAAMSIGDNSAGGYLAPVEWDRRISEALRAVSPMRRLAQVQVTSVGAYSTLWNNDQWGSGWVGETAARPATSNASLSPLVFPTGEIYAMPIATQRLLDDAGINVERWLTDSVQREFNRQEGIAFLSGNGTNKPYGLLTYAEGAANEAVHPGGAIDVTEVAITPDALVDFLYSLTAPYRQNATWLMSSLTAALISKMKDGDDNYIWREGLISGQPATLLGRPVEIDEGMPGPTAGSICIAFGDFRAGYVINDRLGTRILRDPFSNKPYVMFYVTKRVGGGLADPNALRFLRLPV